MDKQKKIELAKQRLKSMRGVQVNEFGILESADIAELKAEIKNLNKVISDGVNLKDIKELDQSEAIAEFGEKVSKSIETIRAGITIDNLDKIAIPEPLKEVKISNLKDLPKFESYKKDFDQLNKAIQAVNKAVAKPQGQNPEDYIPVRIVISPNQRLEFLKTFPIPSFAGGGGGGSVSNYHQDVNIYRNISLVATGVNIKASSGALTGYFISNLHATAVRYVKLYNKATAPTVGTDVPVITIPLQPKVSANVSFSDHPLFNAGIGIGATTGIADNDTGAPDANDVVVNIYYI